MTDDLVDGTVRRCLPLAEWPEPDRAAWTAAHRRGGLLDEDGHAASWAVATSSLIASGYGRFLSFLAETEGLDGSVRPGDRVTRPGSRPMSPDCANAIIPARSRPESSSSPAPSPSMAPGVDWAWLRRIKARLRRMSRPARDDRSRIVPVTTVRDLGLHLMERAEAKTGLSARQRALLFRDGLMICILTASPVRARNVAAMSIGSSVQRRGSEWWVAFGSGETKNGRPIDIPLPDTFTGWIERYLVHHRPELIRRSPTPVAGDAFWLSDGGRPLTAKGVGRCVSAVTERELGRAVSPHLFRKIIPTELAIHDPAHVGVAQSILGHTTYDTTQKAYNLGRAIDAARRHHKVIQSIRGGNGAARPARRPRIGEQSTDRVGSATRRSPRSSRKDSR
jgi:integrase/recombinase XerD